MFHVAIEIEMAYFTTLSPGLTFSPLSSLISVTESVGYEQVCYIAMPAVQATAGIEFYLDLTPSPAQPTDFQSKDLHITYKFCHKSVGCQCNGS